MNKTILITGATGGIGRHAALYLARQGHTVIATGRKPALLQELAEEAEGLAVHTVTLDVNDPTSIEAAVRWVAERGIHVQVLINNAGFGCIGAVMDMSLHDVRRQFETNVFGLLEVSKAFVPDMIRRGSGRVINVSSVGGRMTLPMMGPYNSTKYAVESLSDAMRAELAPLGVQVVLVEPGVIRTNFTQSATASVQPVWVHTSPWRDVYQRSAEITARAERGAPDPTPVSRALSRAITSRRPRARYVAPRHYGAVLALGSVLPTWIVDAMLARMTGLSGMRRIEDTGAGILQGGAA